MKEREILAKKSIVSGEIFLLIVSIFALGNIVGDMNVVDARNENPSASLIGTGSGSAAQAVVKEVWTSKKGVTGNFNIIDEFTPGGSVFKGAKVVSVAREGDKYTATFSGKISSTGEELTDTLSINKETYDAILKTTGADFVEEGAYSKEFPLIGIVSGGWAHLLDGVVWASFVVGAIQLLGPLLGADETTVNALSAAAVAGIFTYKGILAFSEQNFGAALKDTFVANNAALISIGFAVVVFALMYKKESKKIVQLECLPWEAPLGGADCERCNQDPLKPCSEYRCKSLGQACELVNKGSAEERCTWVARGDVNSPIITPAKNVLTQNHRYTDMQGRPPSRGTKIVRTDKECIQPFTPLQFGVQLNEPAQCKIDIEGNKTFDEMGYYFGESNLYRYNHTETMRLPSPDSVNAEGIEVPNEGAYNFYVRCRDANGNVNEDEFVFNLCVDKSPDTTPPIIETTSIISGSAVQFGVQNISLTAYVNEPAECKWSFQDKAYDSMENAMSCSSHVYEQNARQQYPCTTTLNGIQDRAENVFYLRCKDQPLKSNSTQNVNQESYRFSLKGSQPLAILNVKPNETLTGSTDVVRVNLTLTTDDGADEGKALCYFSPTGKESDFVAMFSTNSFKHEQVLSLGSGAYNYYFRCIDAGGNAASANTSFNVFVDRAAPRVTRAYKEGPDALKIITNEEAVCRYSPTSCNFVFGEGLAIQVLNPRDRRVHLMQWKPNEANYIKCRDNYGNEPNPNACSIVVSATNIG